MVVVLKQRVTAYARSTALSERFDLFVSDPRQNLKAVYEDGVSVLLWSEAFLLSTVPS